MPPKPVGARQRDTPETASPVTTGLKTKEELLKSKNTHISSHEGADEWLRTHEYLAAGQRVDTATLAEILWQLSRASRLQQVEGMQAVAWMLEAVGEDKAEDGIVERAVEHEGTVTAEQSGVAEPSMKLWMSRTEEAIKRIGEVMEGLQGLKKLRGVEEETVDELTKPVPTTWAEAAACNCDPTQRRQQFKPGIKTKIRQYPLVIENVPVRITLEDKNLRAIEDVSALTVGTITSATWLKRPEHRREGQTTAHVIMSVTTEEDAREVMERGIVVAGRRRHGRYLRRDPGQCLTCKKFGHIAVECRAGRWDRTSMSARKRNTHLTHPQGWQVNGPARAVGVPPRSDLTLRSYGSRGR